MRPKTIHIFAIILITAISITLHGKEVIADFYFQQGCDDCVYIKEHVIPRLHADGFAVNEYDTNNKENFIRLLSTLNYFADESNESAYLVVNGKTLLAGRDKIVAWMHQSTNTKVDDTESSDGFAVTMGDGDPLLKRTEQLTWITIVIAGFLDGINPCVFSTLVFFLSLLLISKTSKEKLLLAGGSYCFACFLTYFILGFGMFHFLKMCLGYHYLQRTFEGVLILVLLFFSLLSFRDAFRFKKYGMASVVTLQLPKRIKTAIHTIMRNGVRYRYVITGAFIIGVLVTILESTCTGQVYVPTLVLLTKEAGDANRWILYLLLYNLMFILPLLFLFIAAWRGSTMPIFINWSKKNVFFAKMALGCFFILLSGLIIIL